MFFKNLTIYLGFRLPAIAILLSTLHGCATENAQQVALATLKSVAQYEQEVDKKIAAETKFYTDQTKVIGSKLAGTPITADNDATVPDEEIRKTWAYLHIRTSAVADARRVAGEILTKDRAQALTLITDHVANGVKDDHAAILQARAKQVALAHRLAKNLEPIEKQKQRLATLRKGLTALTVAPDNQTKLSQVKAIAGVLFEEAKSLDGGD